MKAVIVVDQNYKDYNPMQFGCENCAPGHAYGPAVRTHWLLHYVVHGFGIFVKDGVTHRVKRGDIFVIPPYEETYYEADQKNPWHYIWIGFTGQGEVPVQLKEPVIHCPAAGVVFEDMLRCDKLENGRSAFLTAKVWELFSILMEGTDADVNQMDLALSCLHSEYANGITIQQVAERLNMNRSYFSELFKERMGMSPQKYLIQLRLEKAAELLTVYEEPPTTAALSVGYPDIYHFSKIFKQYYGVSPRQYQRQFREETNMKRVGKIDRIMSE